MKSNDVTLQSLGLPDNVIVCIKKDTEEKTSRQVKELLWALNGMLDQANAEIPKCEGAIRRRLLVAPAEKIRIFKRMPSAKLLADIGEIYDWLRHPDPHPSESYLHMQRKWIKRPRGRQSTRRPFALLACEAKQADPKVSWMVLARKLCPCGKERHDAGCRDNLRQGVMLLKKMMKSWGCI